MEKKRSVYIDLVKGLSILTLFFLHFENGYIDSSYNYFLVRSPAFYIIVGWLWGLSSHQRTISEHWQKRKKGLVMPYIWLSLIALVFDVLMILCFHTNYFILWRDLYKTICLRGIGTLWFLPALLGGEIIFLLQRELHTLLRCGLFLLAIVIIWQLDHLSNILHFNGYINDIIKAPIKVIENVLQCFVYLSATYYIACHYGKEILALSNKTLFITGTSLLLLAFYLFNFVYISGELLGEIKFITYNIMVGFGIMLFFRSLENFPIWKPLLYIGKNTLNIMFTHFCILFQLAIAIQTNIIGKSYTGISTLVYFVIAFVFQIAIIKFVNRKYPFLVGK